MSELLKKQDIIVFGEDYNRHPHSLEHLMRELIPYNRVIWVETIGTRVPTLSFYDILRSFELIKKWIFHKKRTVNNTVYPTKVITVPAIPFNNIKIIRTINRLIAKRLMSKAVQKLSFKNVVLITSVTQSALYVDLIKSYKKIYYIVDDFSLWPGHDKDMTRKWENILIQKSDLVLATSSNLIKLKETENKKISLLTHGVDFKHFKLNKKTNENITKLCYFGLIDERCDQELLIEIANRFKNIQITIIGTVTVDISKFKSISNVKFIGKLPYSCLPTVLTTEDMLLLPYHMNELTDSINPLKLKEYIATGLPVVASALPEISKLTDYLYVAKDREEFIDIVEKLINKELIYNADKSIQFLKTSETWKIKATQFSTLISELKC